jgi:hypothetical protein
MGNEQNKLKLKRKYRRSPQFTGSSPKEKFSDDECDNTPFERRGRRLQETFFHENIMPEENSGDKQWIVPE